MPWGATSDAAGTDTANGWIASLNAGTGLGGFKDWRLPFITDTGASGCDLSYAGGTDCGYNVQTKSGTTVYSEMAYLWYVELGNLAYCPPGNVTCGGAGVPQTGWGLTNTGPFQHMQSYDYWSGTEYAPDTSLAWHFVTDDGFQSNFDELNPLYAVAVRPGDVAAVPEPGSLVMLLTGLGMLVAARRRRPR